MDKNKKQWNKKIIALIVAIVSLYYTNTVFAQAGQNCADDRGCLDPGFTCDIAKHECVQTYDPGTTQSEGTSGETPKPVSTESPTAIGCRNGQDCVSLINPLATTENPNPSIEVIIGNTIRIIMGIVGSITLVVFLYGGFLWLTSAGNSEKISKGMQAMLWATIGIIVVFSSYAILTLILSTLQAAP